MTPLRNWLRQAESDTYDVEILDVVFTLKYSFGSRLSLVSRPWNLFGFGGRGLAGINTEEQFGVSRPVRHVKSRGTRRLALRRACGWALSWLQPL